jgi:hypothetical protein
MTLSMLSHNDKEYNREKKEAFALPFVFIYFFQQHNSDETCLIQIN